MSTPSACAGPDAPAEGSLDLHTSTATNRLSAGGYDGSGNLTAWGSLSYTYDRLNTMTRLTGNGNDSRFVYTAEDERVLVRRPEITGTVDHYYLRDLAGQVLREYKFLRELRDGG